MFNFFKSKKNKVDKQDANEVVRDVNSQTTEEETIDDISF